MALTLLRADSNRFPPTHWALEEPNGLLAVGGDLSCERLIEAYRQGIFPWYEDDQSILWWSPNPRMVLRPQQAHCSASMRKFLRKSHWQVVIDRDFANVINHCGDARAKATGTWITSSMKQAYCKLHERGFAHSIEVYDKHELVGGLYGVALGRVFYGESMFSLERNASKMALLYLARFLARQGFALIDCQVASEHLFSLGAQEVTRAQFETILQQCTTPAYVRQTQASWQDAANKVVSGDGYILD